MYSWHERHWIKALGMTEQGVSRAWTLTMRFRKTELHLHSKFYSIYISKEEIDFTKTTWKCTFGNFPDGYEHLEKNRFLANYLFLKVPASISSLKFIMKDYWLEMYNTEMFFSKTSIQVAAYYLLGYKCFTL